MTWKFVDMELDDEAKIDGAIPTPDGPKTPDYPYGLRICLTTAELAKLGFDEADMPEYGDMLHFVAMACVTFANTSHGENGRDRRVELQITHMSLENESAEFQDDEAGE